MRSVLRSKIHKATVTEADVAYIGSISIDEALMETVGLWPGEKVLVVSLTSGARLETYVLTGERDSGIIGMNGAAAHLINEDDVIDIMAFSWSVGDTAPLFIEVDEDNRFSGYFNPGDR